MIHLKLLTECKLGVVTDRIEWISELENFKVNKIFINAHALLVEGLKEFRIFQRDFI